MAFCIIQDYAYSPLLAFIGKKEGDFAVSSEEGITVLMYSEALPSEEGLRSWGSLGLADLQGIKEAVSSGTYEDLLDAVQRAFWADYGRREMFEGSLRLVIMSNGDAIRIDRNARNEGYSAEHPAWSVRGPEYVPVKEALPENINEWALQQFEEGNPKSIEEVGQHAVDILEEHGLPGYEVLWSGRV